MAKERRFGKKNVIKVDPTAYSLGLMGESGVGKLQPLDSPVLSSEGWVTMRDLKLGSKVYGEDGNLHDVVGIFPQGVKSIYKVSFNDGTSTECGLEHLWHVQTKKQRENSRLKNDYRYMVKTLEEIMQDYNSPKKGYKYSIPVSKAMNYSYEYVSIDPYILGLLLGDGGFSNAITFTNSELELLNQVIEYVDSENQTINISDRENHKQLSITNKNKESNSIKERLIEYGLYGITSRDKFVPKEYISNSIDVRRKVLAGLVNTDGSVSKGVSLQISTYSERLSKDISEISRSLGIVTVVNSYDRYDENSTDKYDNEVEYIVSLIGDLSIIYDLLSIKHKSKLKNRTFNFVKSIVNIEYVGEKESQCIKVNNPSSLYITDDFIVTHNTSTMVEVLEKLVGEDGYLIANIGREEGVDAIAGAMYEDFRTFDELLEFVDDVVENREDYRDLKVVVLDTVDELYRITEPYVVQMHNDTHTMDKQVKTIKGAFGGFSAGENKVISEILDNVIGKLADVGIKCWFTLHTKRRTVSDVATGEEYDTLTSNLPVNYFNAIKTKLHFLGVASVDRSIDKIKKKQKIGDAKEIGVVLDEKRIITFRDNNFNIDSKSRFVDVVEQIPLNSDALIEAMNDAIAKEHAKQLNAKAINVVLEEQNLAREEKAIESAKEIADSKIDLSKNEELVAEFIKLYSELAKSDGEDAKFKKDKAKVAKKFLDDNGISVKNVTKVPTVKLVEALKLVTV